MIEPVKIGKATLYNMDCMELLKNTPDKFFNIAIIDPPYGIGFGDYQRGSGGNKLKERYTKDGKKKWDDGVPTDEYFNELFRVSINQIIWGGNYFKLPPHKHFIFWHKKNPVPNFADGELAWTSFNKPASYFEYKYYGNINSEIDRFHPTQKPIALYEWLLTNYAKKGDKILDTHLGSMSSVIACLNLGYEITGCELDSDYFEAGIKRVEQSQKQSTLFEPSMPTQKAEQVSLL